MDKILPLAKFKMGIVLLGITRNVTRNYYFSYEICYGAYFGSIKQFYNILWGFIYLFGVFNTVQVISRRVVGRAEETSTYRSLGFRTVECKQLPSFPLEAVPGIEPRP